VARRFFALLWKDFREMRWSWLALVVVSLLLSVLDVVGSKMRHVDTSALAPLRQLVMLVAPVAAMVLSHAVVARELSGKTQLFLESLPVRRSTLFLAKLTLVMGGTIAVGLACVSGLLVNDNPAGLAAVVVVRAAAYGACAGAAFFLVGFLGRYRIPLALLFGIGLGLLVQGKAIEMSRAAPFGLVDENFVLERFHVPWVMLAQAALIVAVCIAAAIALASAREGDVAARLAEKMSQREKMFVACALLTLLVAATTLDKKQDKPPYELAQAAVVAGGGADVAVGTGDAPGTSDDKALAAFLHDAVSTAHAITLLRLPRVVVVASAELPRGVVESGSFDKADGVLFRIHPGDGNDPIVRDRLVNDAVATAVARATHWRDAKEDRRFLLEGFGLYVSHRAQIAAGAGHGDNGDDELLLRAQVAFPEGPSDDVIERWYSSYERAGDDGAAAFSYEELRVLVELAGRERAELFMRKILGAPVPDDVRALWHTPNVDRALVDVAGVTRAQWLAAWRGFHTAQRARLAARLAAQRPVDGALSMEKLSPLTSRARVHIDAGAGATRAAGVADAAVHAHPSERVEVQTIKLDLDRDPLDEDKAVREEHALSDLVAGVPLAFTFTSGDRFAWRIVALGPAGARVASPWHRAEAP
jgi:hypothetical protein